MNVRKALGLSRSKWDEVKFLAKATREQLKHTIVGMRVVVRTDEYVIVFFDRTGLAHKVAAVSKDLGSRDRQVEVYGEVMHVLGLPHHCPQCEFLATGNAAFFNDEEESMPWETSNDTWNTDEDISWDTDEGWL